MDSEYAQFKSLQHKQESNGKQITLHKCGIGKVNAAIDSFDLITKTKPDIVVSSGVAGGCEQTVEIMDIICAETISYHDVWCGKPNALGQIQGMPKEFITPIDVVNKIKKLELSNVKFGKIVSGDWFVDKTEKMHEIKTNFPNAMAVDMESAAIAQVCYKTNTPFISLRIISDIPLRENNHQQYKDFWKNIANNSFYITKKIINSL